MPPRAAEAIVNSECWTDANPMLNLSSFVTTFIEPEARELMNQHPTSVNFADPDMYPHKLKRRNLTASGGCTICGMDQKMPSLTAQQP